MPLEMPEAIRRALRNVITYGDTDIFPFPLERYLFDDRLDECVEMLTERDKNFEDDLANFPPLTIETLTQVGYTGFRRATQIEPFWNAYYLALVVSISDEIEQNRLHESEGMVYSYRYEWCEETSSLFKDSTWNDYRRRAFELSKQFEFVVLTDIADYYPRINHHRLQNTLNRLIDVGNVPYRILELLKQFSQTRSYGLPIGGPASRVLAELALADTDMHLARCGISFCRYVDDYSIFCKSKTEAYRTLVLLSEKLFNEGLSLQKGKTKIVSAAEFAELHRFLDPKEDDDPVATEEQKLLNISIRYDPYSATADEDYAALKEAVADIDIIGILSKEVGKTTIDQAVTKQAINTLRALDVSVQEQAMRVLLDPDNLLTLAPVFVHVMRAIRGIFGDLSDTGKEYVDDALVKLYASGAHLLSVELNLSYYIQALSRRRDARKEEILVDIFADTTSNLLQRQIIHVMAEWCCHYWVSDVKRNFNSYTEWERRAILIGSYCLGDEGRHWRKHVRDTLNPAEAMIKDWAAARWQAGKPLPT